MSNEDSRTVTERTLRNLLEQVPALKPLKVVAQVEVHARGDVQLIRVVMPDVEVTKAIANDARLTLQIRRETLNEMEEGDLSTWVRAYEHGRFRVAGIDEYRKLIGTVFAKAASRQRAERKGESGGSRRGPSGATSAA